MSETILVIGATGMIPQSAARELAKLGASFRIMARDPSRVPSAPAVAGDLSKPETLRTAFAGTSALFLVTNATPNLVTQHRNALVAAREAGVKKIVRVSAWGSRVDAPFAIGRWHGELDAAFQDSTMKYVSLQPHGFMQNTLGYAQSVKATGTIYAPLAQGKVCYIDSRDIGAVAARVLLESKWDDQTLALTGPESFSYDELAKTLGEVIQRPVRYENIPPEVARGHMIAADFPAWLVDDLLTLSKLYAANAASTPADTVERIVGRRATSLRQFFTDFREAFTS